MNQSVKAFINAFNEAERKGWDYIYIFIDLHATVIKPSYQLVGIPTDTYDMAIESLKIMNDAKDMKLVLWTCSHENEIKEYVDFFGKFGISFFDINENKRVENSAYGCYDKKPYYNVLLDDKTGFDANEDWSPILEYLKSRYQ